MPHPFISQTILHSNDLFSSLAPFCTVSYWRKKHILFIFSVSRAGPRLAQDMCKYLKMFNSLVEWLARDFKQRATFKELEPIPTTPEYPKGLLLNPGFYTGMFFTGKFCTKQTKPQNPTPKACVSDPACSMQLASSYLISHIEPQ